MSGILIFCKYKIRLVGSFTLILMIHVQLLSSVLKNPTVSSQEYFMI